MTQAKRKRRHGWKHPARTTVLLAFGMAGIAYETLFDNIDRPGLLVVFMGCLGLPPLLSADERRNKDDEDDEDEADPPAKVEK